MRLPKRGFNNKMFETVYAEVNLGQLQKALEAKKIDATTEVTLETLKAAGLVRSNALRVKLLAKGELKTALTLVVNKASEAAVQAVEKAKGKVTQLVVSA